MRTLVTARAFWVSGEEARQLLIDSGWEVVNSPKAGPLTETELIPLLKDCDAVVASSDIYNATVFAAGVAGVEFQTLPKSTNADLS